VLWHSSSQLGSRRACHSGSELTPSLDWLNSIYLTCNVVFRVYICYCDEWIVKSFVKTVNEFIKYFLIIMHVFSFKSPDNATVRMWESAKFLWNQKAVIYWTRVVTTAALYTTRLSVTKWH